MKYIPGTSKQNLTRGATRIVAKMQPLLKILSFLKAECSQAYYSSQMRFQSTTHSPFQTFHKSRVSAVIIAKAIPFVNKYFLPFCLFYTCKFFLSETPCFHFFGFALSFSAFIVSKYALSTSVNVFS